MRSIIAVAAPALLLLACEGEVTDGGTGSDTDVERIEEIQPGDGVREDAETQATGRPDLTDEDGAPRLGDYPRRGQQATRNPIEPGDEEPGGKDELLPDEREALDDPKAPVYVGEDDPAAEDDEGPDR